jgi:hypothetical protein
MEALYRSGEADLKPLVDMYGTLLNSNYGLTRSVRRSKKTPSDKKATG